MKEVHDHSFNVNVAEYFRSVEKAILLKEFYGWIKINKDSKRNIHYGVAWTYNSSEALNEKFRYMKAKSIWRWIDELSTEGFICINRFNEKRYDKTNWYAINWVAYAAICEGKYELILDAICEFKKFQRLVFDSQNEKSISQNKKRYSQNEKSISQNEEPIPSLTISKTSQLDNVGIEIPIQLHDQIDKTKVVVHNEIKPNKQLQFVTEVVTYLNQKTNQQFKTTTKETIQFINSRVKLDGWELEDFKAVIDFKTNEWLKDDKMRQYLCPSTLFRASNAEKYLLAARASKPKPPVKPTQPTKVHVEERPALTQHDIEYSQAAFATVEQMFKQMGV